LQRGLLFGLGVGDKEGPSHTNLHRIKAAPVRLDRFFKHCDGATDLLWRGVLAEQQIVALLGHLADRALAASAHPDRRLRLLRRRRFDHDLIEGPICTPMRERLIGCPRLADYLEALVEARIGLLHWHTETGELVVPVPFANAEIEPPPGQQVE